MLSNLRELYKYRALIWALTARHLSMRYRGSVLGFLWSFLNPLCLMLVYMLVFRYYIRFDQVNNYTIFLFSGLLPWLWFTSGVQEGVSAITSGGHLITRSMFPAQVLPTVAVITSMIHFVLTLPLLFIFMYGMGIEFRATLFFLPLLVALQFVFVHGLALALGAMNVHFRDTQHVVANLLSFLFFLCPIIYPASAVPAKLKFTLDLNPLALLTQFYHALILDGSLPPLLPFVYFLAWALIAVLVGNIIYGYYRESFAELL